MQCKKCGANIDNTDTFCKNCGQQVLDTNSEALNVNGQQMDTQNSIEILDLNYQTNEEINNQSYSEGNNTIQNNSEFSQYQQVSQTPITQGDNKNKEKNFSKTFRIIGIAVLSLIVLFVIIFTLISVTSKKLICKSEQGNITIMYNNKGLTGYKAKGLKYEFDEQKEYANRIGVDAYLKEFSTWFSKNTTGSCTINGKKVEETSSNTNNTNTNNSGNNTTSDTKVVGDDKYGYITVPNNWFKFYDVDGSSALQYSYASVFIVSLDVIDSNSTAKEYAISYKKYKEASSEVSNVGAATVTIGKNKKYTAYQVYMYYPSDSTILITYWFDTEDGKVHYISLEGPKELNGKKLSDYLSIAETFSLSNY